MTYLNRSATSAQTIKKFHPHIRITVMSNLILSKNDLKSKGFHNQVIIAKEHITDSRQWWTRIMYLNNTPYEYTLSIDSDRVVCNDISEGFNILINGYRGKTYDLLEVSGGVLPAFDNGVIFFRKGWKFNQLAEIWMRFQLAWNKYGNDQGCLANALEFIREKKSLLRNFNVGILPPTWQVKSIPVVDQNWGTAKDSRTLVISGGIKIAASTSCQAFAPVNDTRRRIYVTSYSKDTKKSIVVYSQSECDKVLGNRCTHSEIDWKSAGYHVLDRQDYLARYYPKLDFRSLC
eukprot:gene22954-31260_t